MPTKNPRINVTFEKTTAGLLPYLAKQEHKSISSFTQELVIEALERREDKFLSAIAKSRDTKKASKVKHAHAWK